MARRAHVPLFAGLVCALIVGCGEDPDRAPSTADEIQSTAPSTSAAPSTSTAPSKLERYLLKTDEVPGLAPVDSPHVDTGPPPDLTEDGPELLRSSGYISTTYQPAYGGRGAGVSSVMLFKTAAGARDWMAYETSGRLLRHQIPDVTIKRFQVPGVPGVPGAHGWTGPDLHGNSIGHVYWIQGRCMLLIGLEVEGPRVERLSAGANAIYERTGGTCPD